MGQACAGARESTTAYQKSAKRNYNYAKLKLKGYRISYGEDPSETGKITSMENNFQLCKVGLDEFEKIIADFQEKEKHATQITPEQLVEIFKVHPFLEEIQNENTLTRKLLTHEILEKTKGVIYIPYLRLVGILYCASTDKMAAEAFYDIITEGKAPKKKKLAEGEVPPPAVDIHKSDILIPEYFRKMLAISYNVSIELYKTAPGGKDRSAWLIQELPQVYEALYQEEFLVDIFTKEEKITYEEFLKKFAQDHPKYLQTLNLRRMVFSRVVDIVFTKVK